MTRSLSLEEKYMKAAIREAKKAYALEEVPIGCVIVQNDRIIARGYNRRNTEGNTLAHAELSAIKKASKKTGDWRLEDCTMYVTLEPCQMCAGAIVQSRMKKVVIGSMNPKAGCASERRKRAGKLDNTAYFRIYLRLRAAGVVAVPCTNNPL